MEKEDESQVDLIGDDSTFELIRKIERRTFLYDCRDTRHSKRDIVNQAWDEISKGLKINVKSVDGKWCKKKWKQLRDYYYKTKKSRKGKSGQSASSRKSWAYFNEMDRLLSAYVEENENTKSNLNGDDSDVGPEDQGENTEINQCRSDSIAEEPNDANESTRTGNLAQRKVKRKKFDAMETEINQKLIKFLDEPEENADEFYHFGMTVAKKLRKLSPITADYAMTRITSLLYEISYPQWGHIPQQTTDESAQEFNGNSKQ